MDIILMKIGVKKMNLKINEIMNEDDKPLYFYHLVDKNADMSKIKNPHIQEYEKILTSEKEIDTIFKKQKLEIHEKPNFDCTPYYKSNTTNTIELDTYLTNPNCRSAGLARIIVFEGMKKDLGEKGRKLNPKAYDVDMIWYHYELPKREFKKPENCKDLPLYKQHIVFTGKIPDMTRRQAIQAVFDNGGDYGNQIRQKTTMIVVGEYQNDSTIEIAKTGLTPDQNIKIIDANEFKDIVGWIHANSV